jgi:integrase
MQGGIYSEECCPKCKSKMVDNHRNAVACPDHPRETAHRIYVRFGRKHKRRFTSYPLALKHLNYLRHEKDEREDTFRIEDYGATRPKSFKVLAPKYLERKKTLASYGKIAHDINKAADHFGYTNIRDISGGMIDDYLFGLVLDDGKEMSQKTRANHCSRLHDFWKWCLARGDVITLAEFPTFPKIEYELKYRKIINWEVQEQVINKVKEISYHINPKIWFGIDLLATYTALRPDDLRRMKEDSLDDNGWLTIHNPTKKKNKFKVIRLHEDHISIWKSQKLAYPALPGAPFFRHHGGIKGCKRTVFGEHYLTKWWLKACDIIGLKGVPLYPGTKHTTATETAKLMGTDKALKASGLTNKAFERYCQTENTDAFEVVTEIIKRRNVSSLDEKRKEKEK